jgi:glutamine phosphoribosylpyrophosphate amidotransferase
MHMAMGVALQAEIVVRADVVPGVLVTAATLAITTGFAMPNNAYHNSSLRFFQLCLP